MAVAPCSARALPEPLDGDGGGGRQQPPLPGTGPGGSASPPGGSSGGGAVSTSGVCRWRREPRRGSQPCPWTTPSFLLVHEVFAFQGGKPSKLCGKGCNLLISKVLI